MHTELFLLLISIPILHACSSSKKASKKTKLDEEHNAFILTEISTDTTYGYTETNPVKVGGVQSSSGPVNERRFLNGLSGLTVKNSVMKEQEVAALLKQKMV